MKVMVSKVMARFLRENVNFCRVSYCEMTFRDYMIYVGNECPYGNDYIPKYGIYKALRLAYPDESYACPRFISTRDLNRVFLHSDRTIDGFLEEFRKEFSI